ncbi:hypothetical protein CHLRE_02g118151v5 [Chlamydomonas reinhardtii]|uniref:Uncharacterized protein n=1 Tax=Chlamydomonas reinhardtii TaxID=3055 RepID=A0A2K3E3L2_CHLRE|nr:uncharacterized protein CHLRE_02g118151v5 [Chlamydomonas reinhardtii]PNW87327.1 hypothetical protein CHLRE_02g118151v5 [Chlamydomonas reinhardtii]
MQEPKLQAKQLSGWTAGSEPPLPPCLVQAGAAVLDTGASSPAATAARTTLWDVLAACPHFRDLAEQELKPTSPARRALRATCRTGRALYDAAIRVLRLGPDGELPLTAEGLQCLRGMVSRGMRLRAVKLCFNGHHSPKRTQSLDPSTAVETLASAALHCCGAQVQALCIGGCLPLHAAAPAAPVSQVAVTGSMAPPQRATPHQVRRRQLYLLTPGGLASGLAACGGRLQQLILASDSNDAPIVSPGLRTFYIPKEMSPDQSAGILTSDTLSRCLPRLTGLTQLDITGKFIMPLDVSALHPLSHLTQLRSLVLGLPYFHRYHKNGYPYSSYDAVLPYTYTMQRLEGLDLGHAQLSRGALAALAARLPQLCGLSFA